MGPAYYFPYPIDTSTGVDFAAAQELGVKVIWALALPGKAAPVTAGRIVRDAIYHILTEEGI